MSSIKFLNEAAALKFLEFVKSKNIDVVLVRELVQTEFEYIVEITDLNQLKEFIAAYVEYIKI
jgi:hypothetical protein